MYDLQCTMYDLFTIYIIYHLFFCSIDCCDAESEGDEAGVGETGLAHVLRKGFAPTEGLDAFVQIRVRRLVMADNASDQR